MPRPGARAEQQIATFTEEMRTALGEELVCLVLHGSAAGDEWVAGHSDINTALVVPRVTLAVLERLAPLVARWRERGFALPVLMDYEYLRRARDTFPMELDDIGRQHRLLADNALAADFFFFALGVGNHPVTADQLYGLVTLIRDAHAVRKKVVGL